MNHSTKRFLCLTTLAVLASLAVPARANGPGDLLSSAVRTHGAAKHSLKHNPFLPDEVYQIDDGTAEDSVGLTAGGDTIALNQFTVVSGQNQIGSVNIAWGTPAFPDPTLDGLPYTVVIWSDPNGDGNPADAQVLATRSGVISNQGTNTFLSTSFSPAVAVTNSFFVGFLLTQAAGQFPCAFDESAPLSNRSFIAGGAAGTGNINNLNDNDLPVAAIETFGLVGNWLIRAEPGSGGGNLTLDSAQSVKGRFGIDLPGVEDRTGGPNRRYTMAFTFNNNITSADSVTTSCGTVASSGVDARDAHRFLVSLIGVNCVGDDVTVTLNNVHDDQGNTLATADGTMTLIIGDVDGDGTVTNADLHRVKTDRGSDTNSSNFRSDVNASGHIDNADTNLVKKQLR